MNIILNEGGVHFGNDIDTPDAIIRDIEENWGNHSITQMDSSWYIVGIDGKYGYYEIDVPANGHCRIKQYRYNQHGNQEDDQWLHDDKEWFKWCEEDKKLNENNNMRKQVIKLNESDFRKIVKETVKKVLNEGESGGWVVEPEEAEEAYNMFAAELGNEEANAAIVRALGSKALSDVLAYLFRMYDFRQWDERE